ncbi:hypothetical protein L2E81_15825 [Planktothrix agardhii 1033]|nr:hypothetical protein [Planktothrix agardhii 1033]
MKAIIYQFQSHQAEQAQHQAEQAQHQAEQRAAKLAAKLRELGIDPDLI